MKSRVLAWGLVGVSLAAGLWLACQRTEVAPAARAITWSDADARVAQEDAALYLQAFVGEDGRLALRSTTGGDPPVWVEHGGGLLGSLDPKVQMDALRRLQAVLVEIHADDATPARRQDDGHSRVRLLIDARPGTPWRYVQWVIATACASPSLIYRLAFVSVGSTGWIDNQVPRDADFKSWKRPDLTEATSLVARLSREGTDRPDAQGVTRVGLFRRGATVSGVALTDDEDVVDPPPSSVVSIDLPNADAPASLFAERWDAVETELRQLADTGHPTVGEIRTPHPADASIRYADVATLLALFQELECRRVWFDGAAPTPR